MSFYCKSLTTALLVFLLNAVTGNAQTLKVYSCDASILIASKKSIQSGDPAAQKACQSLVQAADKALKEGPFTVMNKVQTPPSGDKHDYMSLAPYFWPNPNTPNGLPYIRKDGEHNPETKDFQDKDDMIKMENAVETLALAYYFTGKEPYAEHATQLIRAWFLAPETKMNPNLKYGQAVKGVTDGREEGVLETRGFARVIDAIGLMEGSKSWTPSDQKAIETWFTTFLDWIQTNPIGKKEMEALNNHGTWFDAQRLSYALFLGKKELAHQICKNAIVRLDHQMDDKGNFPKEMARTKSLGYTCFVLDAFFQIALQAQHTDVDLWNVVTPTGKSLRKGIETLAPYFTKQKEWTGKQIAPFNFSGEAPLIHTAAIKYQHPEYLDAISKSKQADSESFKRLLVLGF